MLIDLPIPIWAIVLILIVVTIPTFVLITGRNAEGGLRGPNQPWLESLA